MMAVALWSCGPMVMGSCGSVASLGNTLQITRLFFRGGCRSVFPVSQLRIAMHMCCVPCRKSELHLVTILRLPCKLCGTYINSLIWKHAGLPNMMHCSSGDPLACVRPALSTFRMATHLVRCLVRIPDFKDVFGHRPCASVSFDPETGGFVEFH